MDPVLIPILGVSIPLVVVAGKFIVQPIIAALTRLSESERAAQSMAPVEQRLAATEERLERIERNLGRLLDEQEFQRNLLGRKSGSVPGSESP